MYKEVIVLRIEKLEDNKIKISLTEMDFIHFDINREELAMDRKVLHSFILQLMDKISEETDFDPYSGNLMVRAMQSNDGMNIIVSKVRTKHKYTMEELKKAKSIAYKVKQPKASNGGSFITYFFFDFENLCSALRLLDDEFIQKSYVYNYENKYCYIMRFGELLGESQEMYFRNVSILKEYSDKYASGRVCAFHIKEQGKLVAKGKSLLDMTNGIRKIR